MRVLSWQYGIIFLVLALAAAAPVVPLAAVSGWAAVVPGYLAFSFFLFAIANLGAGPGLLGKRPDGRRAWWAWVLFAPFFLLGELSFLLYRLTSRRPLYSPVLPNLCLGRRMTRKEASEANHPRWSAVLDLTAEFPENAVYRGLAQYRCIPTLDGTSLTLEELESAVGWLREQTGRGPVLVHCALGHGRSGMVVAAYLLTCKAAATPADAMAFIRRVRPSARLHREQRLTLAAFAERLLSRG